MLANVDATAFAATTQPERALAFYGGILGLPLKEDTPFALVFASGAVTIRVAKAPPFTALPFTVLGWKVADIQAVAGELVGKGVSFERFGGMAQDELGIWTAPDGSKVAWFKDPDHNVLSLNQAP